MWKDFFYFTKAQRAGVVVLVGLILLVVLVNVVMPFFVRDVEKVDLDCYAEELQVFKSSLMSRDSLQKAEQRQWAGRGQMRNQPARPTQLSVYDLKPFNPNTADSLTLIHLGLPFRVVSNVLKYRSKGGRFKKTDDFSKIYGLTADKFEELKPYIDLSSDEVRADNFRKRIITDSVQPLAVLPDTMLLPVDLNTADTTELMRMKGIGPYYAREIVRYRRQLGGFVSPEQLLEIKHMRPENYDRIKPYCMADTAKIEKIEVNRASVDFLRRHPYINFYQAKAMYELRRAKGRLKGLDDLKRFDEFSDEDIDRLAPYLSFE